MQVDHSLKKPSIALSLAEAPRVGIEVALFASRKTIVEFDS
ncbi:MAG: hypothetical protein ACI831_001104 [Candidatus Azotimanducaceae bacterium]|jgi:hypothetical protein